MVKTYSNKKDGATQITSHFKVREFACHDGTDTVLVDVDGVRKLELMRLWARRSVRVTSGYRTPEHNRKVGGSSTSYHTRGQAFDIVVEGKTPTEAARFAQIVGFTGIEVNKDSNYLHVDTRSTRYYWIHQNGRDVTQSGFGGRCPYALPTSSLRRGANGNAVRWLQFHLAAWGFGVSVDGSFGARTEQAVRDFQRLVGLDVDGHAGPKTRDKLRGAV